MLLSEFREKLLDKGIDKEIVDRLVKDLSPQSVNDVWEVVKEIWRKSALMHLENAREMVEDAITKYRHDVRRNT